MADKRTLAKRDAQVRAVNEMIVRSRAIIEDENKSKNPRKEVDVLLKNIKLKRISIDKLNEDIVNVIEEDRIDGEVQRSSEFDIKIDTEISFMGSYVGDANSSSDDEQRQNRLSNSTPVERRNKVNLPKLVVKKFYGDPIYWPEFIDTFTVAIHENTGLTDVERFTYLKSYVSGEAERCMEGLTFTSINYEHALNILKERFGNKQVIISKHMSMLLNLEKVKSSLLIKDLRSLYDKITVTTRALISYNIDSQQFGPMLIPVILDKLPADTWQIDEIIDILKLEIEARETCGAHRTENSKEVSEKRQFKSRCITTESLHVTSKPI